MIKIDLLKGRGLANKNIAQNITVMLIAVAVPAVLALIMTLCLAHFKITGSIQKKRIANYQARIEQSAQTLAFRKSLENETQTIAKCMSEVCTSIGKYAQWSPVIESVVQNIPDSMVLTKLEAEQKSSKIKKPDGDNSKSEMVNAIVRTLNITVSGNWGIDYDKDVQEFKNKLNSSPSIGPNLSQIRVSRKSQGFDNKETACYEIACTFKPSM